MPSGILLRRVLGPGLALVLLSGALIGLTLRNGMGGRHAAGHGSGLKSCCVEHGEETSELPVFFTLPGFSLTERSGAEVTRETLAGQVWIADFIFTHCQGPCPRMTERMADLQDDLSDVEGLKLVSISVDPRRDTPAQLRKFAAKFRADEQRWLFLTGEWERIYDLSVNGFKLPVENKPADPDHPVLHTTRFVLVDRQGRIRGYYDGMDDDALKRLQRDARSVAAEKALATQPAAATRPAVVLQREGEQS